MTRERSARIALLNAALIYGSSAQAGRDLTEAARELCMAAIDWQVERSAASNGDATEEIVEPEIVNDADH